jgi:hypothetical protein
MRWDALFADLESQFDALQEGDLYGEVADRIRTEVARSPCSTGFAVRSTPSYGWN